MNHITRGRGGINHPHQIVDAVGAMLDAVTFPFLGTIFVHPRTGALILLLLCAQELHLLKPRCRRQCAHMHDSVQSPRAPARADRPLAAHDVVCKRWALPSSSKPSRLTFPDFSTSLQTLPPLDTQHPHPSHACCAYGSAPWRKLFPRNHGLLPPSALQRQTRLLRRKKTRSGSRLYFEYRPG